MQAEGDCEDEVEREREVGDEEDTAGAAAQDRHRSFPLACLFLVHKPLVATCSLACGVALGYRYGGDLSSR